MGTTYSIPSVPYGKVGTCSTRVPYLEASEVYPASLRQDAFHSKVALAVQLGQRIQRWAWTWGSRVLELSI